MKSFRTDEEDNSSFTFSGMDAGEVAAKVNRAILPVLILDASGSIGFASAEAQVRQILIGSVTEMKAKGVHEGAFIGAWDFNTMFPNALNEVIPFTGIDDVNVATIPPLLADGGTPMFEAAFNGISAAVTYATKLDEEGVVTDVFVTLVTDGRPEGNQRKSAADVKALLAEIRSKKAEFGPASTYFAVIGVGDKGNEAFQKAFADEIGADAYFFAGDLKDGTIGKVIGWFSSSVHMSQQMGKSQAVDPSFATE